ncbi:hypothetical protein [Streptomyces sp. TLI_105]|uniref:hypothetical protein n=1 Tax=Streptomyces sp. TLI_105 TaxID=1881019 RepID=UPI000897B125|nr:hypothetical protein [Streptomyces sp. TLI_105]SEE07190.1 hypothetical protein SAMN05428939_7236 [Streptomyces sp. TLI_105]
MTRLSPVPSDGSRPATTVSSAGSAPNGSHSERGVGRETQQAAPERRAAVETDLAVDRLAQRPFQFADIEGLTGPWDPAISGRVLVGIPRVVRRGVFVGGSHFSLCGCEPTGRAPYTRKRSASAISISGPTEALEVPRLAAIPRHTAATLRKGAPTLAADTGRR